MPERCRIESDADGAMTTGVTRLPLHRRIARRVMLSWLTFRVYCDAFLAEPNRFATAIKWRILGKRVRARSQLAALLGLSPRAYRLWVLRRETGTPAVQAPHSSPPIVALVDAAGAHDAPALRATLDCLQALGVSAYLVGSEAHPDLESVAADIAWDQQPWLMPMRVGDILAPRALAHYRHAIAQGSPAVIYADDDIIPAGSRHRHDPHFKPAWNAPLFEHWDFVSGACVVQARPEDLRAVTTTPDWVSALVARIIASAATEPLHLPAVLHHRRMRPQPVLPPQPVNPPRDLPSLSVIVPTRNGLDLLRTCLDGLAKTRYPDMEVIVVDNNSDDPETLEFLAKLDPNRYRVLRHPGPFNYSAINNRAVEQARGTLICLLNNDIEITDLDWLATMAATAIRPDVGAVGARLLYPDGRIQHAGVVLGVGKAAGHAHKLLRPEERGYHWRHALPQFTSAVTAACLVVMRERFMAVGMLNEVDFPVAFNDVDLCLRLNARGWQSFYEPRATLIHHESVSRGHDHDPVGAARFAGELAALKRLWRTDALCDPYHHPQLSDASERFAIAL